MYLINKQKVEELIYSKFQSIDTTKIVLSEILKELLNFKTYNDQEMNYSFNRISDMCMKEQEHIILRFKLKEFVSYIESLPDDTLKSSIMKKVFDNKIGQELIEIIK